MFTKEEIALAKPCYEAIKKISGGKWEWEAEVGEWCLWKGGVCRGQTQLIINIVKVTEIDEEKYIRFVDKTKWEEAEGFIPLLHWERIEEILEGMGYCLTVDKRLDAASCGIWEGLCVRFKNLATGKCRQLAVMRAVIELGKVT